MKSNALEMQKLFEDLVEVTETEYCLKKRVHGVKNVLKSWKRIKIL